MPRTCASRTPPSLASPSSSAVLGSMLEREIGNLLPNNRRQRRTCYALCHILYPVSAAHKSIFRMDSNSTSYPFLVFLSYRSPVQKYFAHERPGFLKRSSFLLDMKKLTKTNDLFLNYLMYQDTDENKRRVSKTY